jgi:archaellum component FlaC
MCGGEEMTVAGLRFNDRYRELISDQSEYIEQLKKEKEEAEEKYMKTFDQLERTDMDLENHKNWLKTAGEELNRLQKENKHLWALIGLKAAELNG